MRKYVLSLLATLLLGACASLQSKGEKHQGLEPGTFLTGPVEVLTGETLRISGQAVGLAGILTPPPGQGCIRPAGRTYDCGYIAATALMDLTAGAEVACVLLDGRHRSGYPSARCQVQGYDLSEGMVYTGWALAWPPAAQPLRRLEAGARNQRRGMWNGRFEPLWPPAIEGA